MRRLWLAYKVFAVKKQLAFAILGVLLCAIISVFIGVSNVTPQTLLSGSEDGRAMQVLLVSRIPRTLAIMLSGASMSVAGLIMQILVRNHFVSPSTAGTVESAALGLLVVTVLMPSLSVFGKMLFASCFALAGTLLFLQILRQIPLRSVLTVPLVGLILGGVISAVTTFFAYRLGLLQSLNAWLLGSFAGILRGRYELLWVSFFLTIIAYIAADQFTVAGMGKDFSTNLGMNYRWVMALGLMIVSMITAVVVVTVGMIPFLGLVVPNVVRLMVGDNVRIAVPWVVLVGIGFVLICDIIGRIINYPYEIPVSVVMGILGSVVFLYLLLRREARAA